MNFVRIDGNRRHVIGYLRLLLDDVLRRLVLLRRLHRRAQILCVAGHGREIDRTENKNIRNNGDDQNQKQGKRCVVSAFL